ncbi:MAG TPA: diadenylate cyclase CdaA [Trueperaceae bacterium]|nr:diadenylate cyclase CdaA [Trueperaceae bacterium]
MAIFEGFGIQDVIDILIIAVLLYQSYALLRGTRAWNVLRGLLAVAGLWFLAGQAGLQATKWLFDAIAPVGFFAVVVVFQPELRAVLERVGRGRMQRSVSADPVSEIMTAVRELASQRKGLLVAVERRTPLKEYADRGTSIGAPVSAALLQTIFASTGPLHDGAVIIKEDLVTHAGVIFPLSDKHEGWSVKHGTRHRAALGLSEVTDALVVVVSEERGTVSIAEAGVLTTDIAPADVLKALREAYAQ